MSDDLDIPDGSRVSSDPIAGGIVVLNAAFPPGHDEHKVWRTPTNSELADQVERGKQFAVSSQQAKWAMLRIERNRRLTETDWTELPSAARRLSADQLAAWAAYRQALRDVPSGTLDPDAPLWPAAPGSTDEASGGVSVASVG